MKKLKSRQELQELRRVYSSALAAEQKKVLVCAGTGCISSGSLLIFDRLRALIEEQGLRCEVELEKEPHDHMTWAPTSPLRSLSRPSRSTTPTSWVSPPS